MATQRKVSTKSVDRPSSSTCRTHRSLTFGSIFFGMVRILPTHKDAASNLGRFTEVNLIPVAAVTVGVRPSVVLTGDAS